MYIQITEYQMKNSGKLSFYGQKINTGEDKEQW